MTDLKLDDNGDIMFDDNGELVMIDDATQQNQKLILLSHPGDWKEHPRVGVGIFDYLLDDGDGDIDELQGIIQEQMEGDGQTIDLLELDGNLNLKLEALYKRDDKR